VKNGAIGSFVLMAALMFFFNEPFTKFFGFERFSVLQILIYAIILTGLGIFGLKENQAPERREIAFKLAGEKSKKEAGKK